MDKGVPFEDKMVGRDGFNIDEIVRYKYSVTTLEGDYRKKSTQVTVDNIERPITNEEIMKQESVRCKFQNLKPSMIGNPIYYRADKIQLLSDK